MPVPETDYVTPLTLLEAVNQLLFALGSSRVDSLLQSDMDERAQDALRVIVQTSKMVQEEGWHFNTRENVSLTPEVGSKEIVLPLNVAAFKVAPKSHGRDITMVGQRLYDREANTFQFERPIYGEYILLFPFEEVPPPIRSYITAKAGSMIVMDRQPDSRTSRFSEANVADAYAKALQHDGDSRDVRARESSEHFYTFNRGRP